MTNNNSSFPDTPQLKKSRNRCLSCKKLKIKCDEAKPKCEYCEHTKRECIYPDPSTIKRGRKAKTIKTVERKERIEQINSSAVELWNRQMCLNSVARQLDISQFEFRLLHYFQEHYIRIENTDPLNKVWKFQVPKLWQESDIVRQSIFSLSAMHLWALCDLTSLIQDDIMDYKSKKITFLKNINCNELFLHPNTLKAYLYDKTGEYFTNCLQRTNCMMDAIINQNYIISTVFQAAEVVISGILLFSFLALQPHGLIPLLSCDSAIPDILSMCKGMKTSMSYAFPLLYDSPYRGLFHLNETMDPPTITEKDRYPLIEYLRDELEKNSQVNKFPDDEYKIFKGAIDMLEIDFYRTIETNNPLPIYRWIFLIDIKMYDIIKVDRNSFGLKLMYIYTCLCVMCQFRLDKKTNIWLEYMDWYKDYNYRVFGKWNDSFDQEMYELVVGKKFEIPSNSYHLLETFVPLMYL
ncbi:DEHA2D18810p [Debaryomyces hansenii CBS767]|uniref:DEHA2D18810p n=1 Tax=Debaryomyces hansenii (strain ATCC 36239 / CBS 767 / BCRC 21394 / JCM 1990 / NBRC 0083 / IGC 2968) TaxID=284592 RepID=Q6BR67_DEBHA|nr:DEHA2D18810p [Debaryomyces hansenii CBS767]CAG87477.1 DEHA2D18810p [Debaryomyces hansenii CBS767]|eukprot:XP_459303.1 DEHA2D18810p [Debaryomyces hansenii CBS767]